MAKDCDIILRDSNESILETISAIKLEEQLRPALAEANYIAIREKSASLQQIISSENLVLNKIE